MEGAVPRGEAGGFDTSDLLSSSELKDVPNKICVRFANEDLRLFAFKEDLSVCCAETLSELCVCSNMALLLQFVPLLAIRIKRTTSCRTISRPVVRSVCSKENTRQIAVGRTLPPLDRYVVVFCN
jgi:hypothetical protein